MQGIDLQYWTGKWSPRMDATPALPLLSLIASMALLWWAIDYLRR